MSFLGIVKLVFLNMRRKNLKKKKKKRSKKLLFCIFKYIIHELVKA